MDRPVYETKAWRVTFAGTAPQDESAELIVTEPGGAVAVSRPVDVDEALTSVSDARSETIDLIWLPPSAGSGQEIEKRLEPDSKAADASLRPPIRASLRSTRVVWTNARAVIATAPDQLADAIDAVVRFTLAERRTIALEREMADIWPQIETYKALTHRVTRRQLGLQGKIGALTERITTMSVDTIALETAIEQLDPKLTSGSKRLYAELVLQAGIYERLEMLEDPIDFAQEHFELANDRLIDHRSALTGFYLEALIVVVLTAELFVFLYSRL
jgi:hypothetical protein